MLSGEVILRIVDRSNEKEGDVLGLIIYGHGVLKKMKSSTHLTAGSTL